MKAAQLKYGYPDEGHTHKDFFCKLPNSIRVLKPEMKWLFIASVVCSLIRSAKIPFNIQNFIS